MYVTQIHIVSTYGGGAIFGGGNTDSTGGDVGDGDGRGLTNWFLLQYWKISDGSADSNSSIVIVSL